MSNEYQREEEERHPADPSNPHNTSHGTAPTRHPGAVSLPHMDELVEFERTRVPPYHPLIHPQPSHAGYQVYAPQPPAAPQQAYTHLPQGQYQHAAPHHGYNMQLEVTGPALVTFHTAPQAPVDFQSANPEPDRAPPSVVHPVSTLWPPWPWWCCRCKDMVGAEENPEVEQQCQNRPTARRKCGHYYCDDCRERPFSPKMI